MRYDNMSAFIVMDIVREAATRTPFILKSVSRIYRLPIRLKPHCKMPCSTINLVTQKALDFWRCEKKSPRIMTALIR